MQSGNLEEQIITLESDDGKAYSCKILGVFEFDGKEYALLLNINDEEGAEGDAEGDDASTVIMQMIEQDDQAIFRTIESDEEFNRVVAHVQQLAQEMADSEDEEEGA